MPNTLYYGDNLDIMRRYIKDESVDLVYLDPPFNSAQNYNVLFAEKDGTKAASQITAFEDTWTWDTQAAKTYDDIMLGGGKLADCIQAFRKFVGENDLLAYLVMMAPRLAEIHRVLKPTGSVYLHCDPSASHYLKLLLDAVFGPEHFLSEIIWKRTSSHSGSKRWAPVHDTIFHFRKTKVFTWNPVYVDYGKKYIADFYKNKDEQGIFRLGDLTGAGTRGGSSGKEWRGVNPTDSGRHWAPPNKVLEEAGVDISKMTSLDKLDKLDEMGLIYFPPKGKIPSFKRYLDGDGGVSISDMIVDITPLGAKAAERLGYPTQKPEALLERIITASSNEGDTVLDPFCGCGTTVAAAQKLKRNWIGIDITHLAVNLIRRRLFDTYGRDTKFDVIGEPKSVPDATQLAESDPYQFQYWALGLVGARPVEQKKGADKGIDGTIIFQGDTPGEFEKVLISVKAGHTSVAHVRDLVGVITRDKAAIGVLISMEEHTKPMKVEATTAGFHESTVWGKRYPKVQLFTIQDLMDGKSIDMPPIRQTGQTFKVAPKAKKKHEGLTLNLQDG